MSEATTNAIIKNFHAYARDSESPTEKLCRLTQEYIRCDTTEPRREEISKEMTAITNEAGIYYMDVDPDEQGWHHSIIENVTIS